MFKKRFSRTGQAISLDLFFAIAIFAILMTVIIVVWNIYTVRLNEGIEYNEMQIVSFQVTDFLVKNVLVDFDRNFSNSKVNSFFNLSYDETRDMLNIMNYDYYLAIMDVNGTSLVDKGVSASGEKIISLRRYVLYQNEKAILLFKLWK